jgi:hypothetical protein
MPDYDLAIRGGTVTTAVLRRRRGVKMPVKFQFDS